MLFVHSSFGISSNVGLMSSDSKFHDIPNTICPGGCRSGRPRASDGKRSRVWRRENDGRSARRAGYLRYDAPLLIAATVLTSIWKPAICAIWAHVVTGEHAERLARLRTQQCADGVVPFRSGSGQDLNRPWRI